MTPQILGLILGGFVFLVGLVLIENAAFADRAMVGFWVAVTGAVMVIAAAAEMLFKMGGM